MQKTPKVCPSILRTLLGSPWLYVSEHRRSKRHAEQAGCCLYAVRRPCQALKSLSGCTRHAPCAASREAQHMNAHPQHSEILTCVAACMHSGLRLRFDPSGILAGYSLNPTRARTFLRQATPPRRLASKIEGFKKSEEYSSIQMLHLLIQESVEWESCATRILQIPKMIYISVHHEHCNCFSSTTKLIP